MAIEERNDDRMCVECTQKVAGAMVHPEFIKDIHDACKESAIGYWKRTKIINLKMLF